MKELIVKWQQKQVDSSSKDSSHDEHDVLQQLRPRVAVTVDDDELPLLDDELLDDDDDDDAFLETKPEQQQKIPPSDSADFPSASSILLVGYWTKPRW